MTKTKPRIAITMGDPAGVGPELCLRAAILPDVIQQCDPIVYGDSFVLSKVAKALGLEVSIASFSQVDHLANMNHAVRVIGCGGPNASENIHRIEAGNINELTGQISFDCVQRAIDDAIAGKVDAVVTGPINKRAWELAGIQYPGHTELFADRCGTDDFCMMMTAPKISCSLVTCHVGLNEVPQLLTIQRIAQVIQLTRQSLRTLKGHEPRLVALGFNPHAGEQGLFGNGEEEKVIRPAVERARDSGTIIEGPVPPDTAFLPSRLERTDGHICMYHDQGLIPFKALAFDTGVNTTLGLPIVRTSVDHGTALDIAWQGIADPSSLLAAVDLAVRLARQHV